MKMERELGSQEMTGRKPEEGGREGGRGERLLVVPYMREVATAQRPLIVFKVSFLSFFLVLNCTCPSLCEIKQEPH